MAKRWWRAAAPVLLAVALGCGGGDGGGGDGSPDGDGGPDAGDGGTWSPGDGSPPDPVVPPAAVGEPFASVRVRNEGSGATGTGYATFGLPFRPGQVPEGSHLGLRVASGDGSVLPTQADLKATHADGSWRHAVITVELPPMEAGEELVLEVLRTDGPLEGAAVDLADLLATGFDGRVTLDLGGRRWTASAAAALRDGSPMSWLGGPLAGEWIASAPLRDEAGTEHPHLRAWFHVRAYRGLALVRVDTILENGWTYVPDPSNLTYGVRLSSCGREVLALPELIHHHHARWRHTSWCGEPAEIGVVHDPAYLASTRAIPNLDLSVTVAEEALDEALASWEERNGLMEPGLALEAMPAGGGRPDIGPVPNWNLLYLRTGDRRARLAALGTADRAGAWPIHYRNASTLRPVTIDEFPYLTLLGRPGDSRNPETGEQEIPAACSGACDVPLQPDSAHQPAFSYVPYLLTGDYFHLEELHFWSHWNLLRANPHYRDFDAGLVKWEQVRGQAWTLRTLAEAAYVTPDDHPHKAFFVEKLHNNLRWYRARLVDDPEANRLHFNEFSRFPYHDRRGIAPWQDDFFTWALGRAWELGFEEALPVLRWKAGFVVLRMTDPGYCWILASQYSVVVRDAPDAPFYSTMSQVYEATIAPEVRRHPCGSAEMAAALELRPGEMIGYSSSPQGYPSNMQIALALAADSGAEGAAEAWSRFEARSVLPDYSRISTFAIVPRNAE